MLGGRPRALLSNRSSQLWLGRHHASETCLSPKECVTLHIPDKCTDLEWGSINSMAHVVRLTDCFRRLGRAKPWEPPIIPPTIASSAVTLANSGVSSRNGDSRCSLFSGSQKSVLRNVKKKKNTEHSPPEGRAGRWACSESNYIQLCKRNAYTCPHLNFFLNLIFFLSWP